MTVTFDTDLYSEQAIRQAIDDYAEIAEIEIINTSKSCICTITRSKYAMAATVLEFSNYVLNLSVMSEKNA